MHDYHYPEPHEPHPVAAAPQRRKIQAAAAATRAGSTDCRCIPVIHGYGPEDDFAARCEVVADSAGEIGGVWINRYGYLSDGKLSTIRDVLGVALAATSPEASPARL